VAALHAVEGLARRLVGAAVGVRIERGVLDVVGLAGLHHAHGHVHVVALGTGEGLGLGLGWGWGWGE